ncbi:BIFUNCTIONAL INHIBITOR/LIPID-TRANSFER PROTEIN/SEED STORAGE 2S ALBUMIN SUPERFAMILY PROTEIN [Salix viminalis]|uniref:BIFUNCTIONAL INHIBITOR/LIPID-TRANSFER PROTEIN/SEED STORAGE 2S ALBUMIN SUPERFAMILY PROTEIN n=1 Tax=Salix viminalis TaxID=40686 RepID=A0A9Q0NS24_SALVM|nr:BIFUNCTIONAL INHIBITOR/LIPID-TRANSFER PROTEIN/SEED STORAGE 2S ALBUMIN SUPERFAMILY PROTEIN [Salix viminalis]
MEKAQKLFFCVALLLAVVAMAGDVANAQSTICKMPIAGLMACKPAVTPPTPAAPTADCCSALSHADISCLCSYKNSNLLPSLGIDPKLAMQLPAKCKLPTPANC